MNTNICYTYNGWSLEIILPMFLGFLIGFIIAVLIFTIWFNRIDNIRQNNG